MRGTGGTAIADPAGVLPGRGAYLCPRAECAERALHRGALRQALRAPVTIPQETLDLVSQWQRSASIR